VQESRRSYLFWLGRPTRPRLRELSRSRPSIVKPGPPPLRSTFYPTKPNAACDATCTIRFSQTRFPRASSNQSCAREACGMGTRGGGGGGSASRVGDWDVDLSDRWDWSSIPRLLSSACLFFCSGWVRFPPASPVVLPRNSLMDRGRLALLQVNRLLVAGTLLLMGAYP
jgi:hypothetical protein